MINLLAVFICIKCGKVLGDEVERTDIYDEESKETVKVFLHSKCGNPAIQEFENYKGQLIPRFEEVSEDRWRRANGYCDQKSA